MQPLTFACPKCGRRMGVGLELMGKSVRCPHCRQVVVAPANTLKSAESGRTMTPPEAFASSSEAEYPLPQFAPPPRREGAESIFGESEHEDDSLFADATARKPLLPDLPGATDFPDPKQPSGRIDFNTPGEPPPAATDVLGSAELPRPGGVPITPLMPKELSQPDFALLPKPSAAGPDTRPVPHPLAREMPPEPADPWAALPRPVPVPESPAAVPPKRDPIVWLLAAYAAVMTLLAVWGWLRK